MVTQSFALREFKPGELVYHLQTGTLFRVTDTRSPEEQPPDGLIACERVTAGARHEALWVHPASLVKVKDLSKPEVRELVGVFTSLPRKKPGALRT
jgi:hypothetical protein